MLCFNGNNSSVARDNSWPQRSSLRKTKKLNATPLRCNVWIISCQCFANNTATYFPVLFCPKIWDRRIIRVLLKNEHRMMIVRTSLMFLCSQRLQAAATYEIADYFPIPPPPQHAWGSKAAIETKGRRNRASCDSLNKTESSGLSSITSSFDREVQHISKIAPSMIRFQH